MNPIMCYFLLQLVGLYAGLLVLDYVRNPGSRYFETEKTAVSTVLPKKPSLSEDRAA